MEVSAPDGCNSIIALYRALPGPHDWGIQLGKFDPDPPCAPPLRRGSSGVGSEPRTRGFWVPTGGGLSHPVPSCLAHCFCSLRELVPNLVPRGLVPVSSARSRWRSTANFHSASSLLVTFLFVPSTFHPSAFPVWHPSFLEFEDYFLNMLPSYSVAFFSGLQRFISFGPKRHGA